MADRPFYTDPILDKRILLRRAFFQRLEKMLDRLSDHQSVTTFCELLARYACDQHPGVFSSPSIEGRLRTVASSLGSSHTGEYDAISGDILHVATSLHMSGGHSRVIENWIENSADDSSQSLFLTDHRSLITHKLKTLEDQQKVRTFRASAADPLEAARQLRDLANRFNYIVLHTHMYDVVPLLAFGGSEFSKPVILFNHADHVFWLGVSIADAIFDQSHLGAQVTEMRRGASTAILPIPLNKAVKHEVQTDKSLLRRALGIPDGARVILSIGSGYKFRPFPNDYSFTDFASSILDANPDAYLIVVGPDPKKQDWEKTYKKFSPRLVMPGVIEHHAIGSYYQVADLYLDSFPTGGGTALTEAISNGCITIPIDNGFTMFDCYRPLAIKPKTIAAEVTKYIRAETNWAGTGAMRCIENNHYPNGWRRQLAAAMKGVTDRHQVLHTRIRCPIILTDFDRLIFTLTQRYRKSHFRAIRKAALPMGFRIRCGMSFLVYRIADSYYRFRATMETILNGRNIQRQ